MRTCAIHQPNFFPWLGYFDKIRRTDVFVFLDQVSYPKSGKSMGSWCNRVKININGKANWISCPVVREHGEQIIDKVLINDDRPWREELMKTIEISYKKHPNFRKANELIKEVVSYESVTLADFNINAIKKITNHLGYKTEFVRQSELTEIEGVATQRLISICSRLEANEYICGGGAVAYQEDHLFGDLGIKVTHQNFSPEVYGGETFIPGLSIIDWLMWQ